MDSPDTKLIALIVVAFIGLGSLVLLSHNQQSVTGNVIYNFDFKRAPPTFEKTVYGFWDDMDNRYDYSLDLGPSSILKYKVREPEKIEFIIPAFKRYQEIIAITPSFYISTDKFELRAVLKGLNTYQNTEDYVKKNCTTDAYTYHREKKPVYYCTGRFEGPALNFENKGQLFRIDLDDTFKEDVYVYQKVSGVVEYRKI